MATNVSKYEVVKGYVPTSVPAGSYGNYNISNGTVTAGGSLINRGYSDYPSAYDGSRTPSSPVKTPRNTTTPTGGNTKSSSGSGSSASASAATDTANSYNALLAAYQAQQNDYSDYLRQMREAAQSAYDRGMSALNSAYDNQLTSLGDNLNETTSQLANQYNRSKDNITRDAEGSLRQAYINRMMAQKNLGQQMSAQGLNGGATETTMAGMLNNYNNARNNINATTNNNLTNLEGNYSDNLSQARQAYNSAVASANLQKAQQAMALENALANNQISALGDYQSLMQRENQNYIDLLKAAIANGASFTWNPTEANNTFRAINLQQAANPTLDTNYQAARELMDAQSAPGTSSPGVTVVNPAVQGNYLAQILSQLRG